MFEIETASAAPSSRKIFSLGMIKLYNTLTRRKEIFKPIHKEWVGLYTCGPTVYNFAHIGNLRTYIFEDVLRRTLEYAGYKVRHIMNITDVGHLTSDADEGEDKLEKGAEREKLSVWEIARFYTGAFLKDMARLNIKKAHKLVPATSEIKDEIRIIEKLFEKGFAYETAQAVYFDVSKFKNYTKLSGQKLSQKMTGAREEVVIDPEKRNPYDFALWFKAVGRFKNHIMRWPSPWGTGFPGWHIECSAISTKYLGQPFDIHTGGVDHINVHHTNEIAQSEAAYAKPLAKFWMHGEFLKTGDRKMAKSGENFITLGTLVKKNYSPLAFRYLALTTHYRSKLNFTWEALGAAEKSFERLYNFVRTLRGYEIRKNTKLRNRLSTSVLSYHFVFRSQFQRATCDDLDMPKALAVMWELIHGYNKKIKTLPPEQGRGLTLGVLNLLYDFDRVLGLGLNKIKPDKIPLKIKNLAVKREELRREKKWQEADRLREEIKKLGYDLRDMPEGPKIKRL